MKLFSEPLAFDWDEGNTEKNYSKHQVSKQEAEEIFVNEPLLISEDSTHSHQEKRLMGLGITNANRALFVSFTMRNKKIRVISVRDMSKKERRVYEKLKETS